MAELHVRFVIERVEREYTLIRDVGHAEGRPTVTNRAEDVVAALAGMGMGVLPPGRRLFYYDSEGHLDEIVHNAGRFVGFNVLLPEEVAHFGIEYFSPVP